MHSYRWKIAAPQEQQAAEIAASLQIPALLAQCLINRGCTTAESASTYLEPRLAKLSDPFTLPNMQAAVKRLFQAHRDQERFVIFGDYDVDGVTATALLSEFFTTLGWNSFAYLPHRVDEGYGLTTDAVQNCLGKFGVRLILAVDCGSTSIQVIKTLADEGVEVIVLDHHQLGPELPPAAALVNPQLLPGDHTLKNLCSAGLAFKLAHALLKKARDENWPGAADFDLKSTLDLVALGTVADMVPLVDENRILTKIGLKKLESSHRPGILALKKVAGINGTVSSYEIGFQLAPRLNAAGRLETALDALGLLLVTQPERASALAQVLDQQNRERQALEQKIVSEVLLALRSSFNPQKDFAIVEGQSTWHVGVVGIVASRVLREFHRPVFILGSDSKETFRGSGRSIDGFDLASALRECGDLLLKHGGHAMAAGITLNTTAVSLFRDRLSNLVRDTVPPELLQPSLRVDAQVRLKDITFQLMKSLESIDPTGPGNPPVHFIARDLQLCGECRRVGADHKHLKFTVTDGTTKVTALWWNCPDEPGGRFDLAFTPELSEFNGTFGIQLKVLDLKPLQ
jgi:single-stranded-DNA-specific exonuclease